MRDDDSNFPAIGDYAIIGDSRSAALISKGGSLDWLCLPRFDSSSLFAAILDRDKGGRFVVCPAGDFTVHRRYLPDTNVLETTFETESGRLTVTDLIPVASEAEKRRELWPEHQVLRRVDCLEGQVEVRVLCDPRPDYGRIVPSLRRRGELGLWYEHRAEAMLLRSEIPLDIDGDAPGAEGRETLKEGDRRWLGLVYSHREPAVIPTFGEDADRKLESTVRWWRRWAERCDYEGTHRDHVVRSALTLKLLTYAPSGAVIAAPTTSLPEEIGGERNWDYRYCWLRDASITLQAFLDLDQESEAHAFLSWILHSTRLSRPELQVLYDVHGETRLVERELDHLEGYRGSSPVRVGNDARNQLQLDTYGEVADAAAQFVRRGGRLDRSMAKMLTQLGDTVCKRWYEPDEGIWEPRSGRTHHTYSMAMCWAALDRLLELHDGGHLQVDVERFAVVRKAIRHEIETRGFNEELGSYVSELDGDQVDASLLLLGRTGYAEPTSERMLGTTRLIEQRLGHNGVIYRYRGVDDGVSGGEGAFGIASFWLVDCLCRQGRHDEAEAMFDHLCDLANDVGLYAEEIDPETGACLGNFPQAFSHAGLIDAALTLAAARGEEPAVRIGQRGEATP